MAGTTLYHPHHPHAQTINTLSLPARTAYAPVVPSHTHPPPQRYEHITAMNPTSTNLNLSGGVGIIPLNSMNTNAHLNTGVGGHPTFANDFSLGPRTWNLASNQNAMMHNRLGDANIARRLENPATQQGNWSRPIYQVPTGNSHHWLGGQSTPQRSNSTCSCYTSAPQTFDSGTLAGPSGGTAPSSKLHLTKSEASTHRTLSFTDTQIVAVVVDVQPGRALRTA